MAGQGSKGGGQVVAPMAGAAPASGMTPLAPTAGFNVNQASAGALQGALGGTQAAMTGPLQVGAYMNPYTQNVIDRTQQDIARQQEMAMNQLGAQATRARAFGGSRQGVAEGVMAGGQARLGAASQLGALGQQAFGAGQAIQQQQMQQGLMQQMLQQSLIDAAKGQYAGYTGAPQAALAAPLAALGETPTPQSTTTSSEPGLFSYLQALTGMGAFG